MPAPGPFVRLLCTLLAIAAAACHDDVPASQRDLATPDLDTPDIEEPPDLPPAPDLGPRDIPPEDVVEELCPGPGLFGCACEGQGDCLDGICVEGPDGNICTRNCVTECPAGFECLTTSIGGPDPVSICVPQHTRLCRPCQADFECQNLLDPLPSACIPATNAGEGSFCATSCAQGACPDGFSCEDVERTEGTTSRLCVPVDGLCDCRPSWDGLGFVTACRPDGEGVCDGTRTCGMEGLTACNARPAEAETCNLLDDDCNGLTDDVEAADCVNSNDYGTCQGSVTCRNGEPECGGQIPGEELCNLIDDDCDGDTDEAWPNCPAASCYEADGAFYETGAPGCQNGACVFGTPRPCGLFTCEGGGDGGLACATSCDSDAVCVESAYCDLERGICEPDVANGGACDEGRECASGYCTNGFCCDGGDCCGGALDCPPEYGRPSSCDDGATCQGTRLEARCIASSCTTSAPIDDDSGCGDEVLAVDCSPLLPRYCTGQVDQTPPVCGATCSADSDCVPGFYCDEVCTPKLDNGEPCDAANQCDSGWCENGFCCNDGDCCAAASDCPDTYRDPSTCLDVFSCQGERRDATCLGFQCGSTVALDDSGCDENVEANDCGPYSSVYCSGQPTQQPPRCTFSCTSDAQCDDGFWCNGTCVPKLADGSFCNGNNACQSDYCNNNICCQDGNCCNFPQDCPPEFSSSSTCNTAVTCSGTKTSATCQNKMCGSVEGVADDSGCTSAVVADECGPYPSVRCNGQADQSRPACATSCGSNAECDLDAFCQNGTCRPKLVDGSPCNDRTQCESDHCQNGFCCASGDCCATAGNCDAEVYGGPSICQNAASCTGDRLTPACESSQCRQGTRVADDSGCAGQESNACGYYLSVSCSAQANQTAPSCPTSCTSNSQCDPGANCTNGECVPNQGAGGPCTTNGQCGDGLTCVDGVCCTSSCTGGCQACNVPGSVGICRPIPDGQDPAGECGAISCTGYYWGFDGSTCFRSANVGAAAAACGGDSACQAADDVCDASGKGASHSSCHATCQTPTPGTCTGTTPPQCTNVTGGSQTCGVGACQRTVDVCSGGAPQACVPGQPTAEVCDGIDNDCDGLTDAADPDLVLVACENQSGVCNGATKPAALCSAGRWLRCGDSQYAAHSGFYQAGTETSCDGRDNDCSGQTDEDFVYTSPAGTVVNGAGQSCGTGACAGGVTQCATATTLRCSTDNRISQEICDGGDNDCDGLVDSLDGSLQLVQCQNQTGVCNGSMRPASLCASGTWQNCSATHFSAHSQFYESTEASCDGRDNDCNGGTDTNLSAPLNDNQLGVCSGSRKACTGAGGWVESYANVANYNANESAPDAFYRDENCDGIDGNVNQGIFVSTGGTDGSTCGLTAQTACRSVQYAIDNRVSTSRPYVYVRAGTYGSSSSPALNFSRAARVFGGYNTNWLRAARTTSGHLVTLTGRDYNESGNVQYMAVRVVGVGTSLAPARLADLRVRAVSPASTERESDGSGKSSYAVYARSSTLIVERCEVVQGNGATGAAGSPGTSASQTAAPSGGTGGNAERKCNECSTAQVQGAGGGASSCDATNTLGGRGGNGGPYDGGCDGWFGSCGPCNAEGGTAGGAAAVTSGTSGLGGRGGGTCQSSTTPGNGNPGRVSHGSGGSGATGTMGQVVSSFWRGFSGANGGLGSHGGGGGGGGGAGACDDGCDQRGASGGGGGAGGCRATATGKSGAPGGGSFGVFAVSATVTVANTLFQRGSGGTGGAGGNGGLGQPGGVGGPGGLRYSDPVTTNSAGAGGAGANRGGGGARGGGVPGPPPPPTGGGGGGGGGWGWPLGWRRRRRRRLRVRSIQPGRYGEHLDG